jgi:hypothetical protein
MTPPPIEEVESLPVLVDSPGVAVASIVLFRRGGWKMARV